MRSWTAANERASASSRGFRWPPAGWPGPVDRCNGWPTTHHTVHRRMRAPPARATLDGCPCLPHGGPRTRTCGSFSSRPRRSLPLMSDPAAAFQLWHTSVDWAYEIVPPACHRQRSHRMAARKGLRRIQGSAACCTSAGPIKLRRLGGGWGHRMELRGAAPFLRRSERAVGRDLSYRGTDGAHGGRAASRSASAMRSLLRGRCGGGPLSQRGQHWGLGPAQLVAREQSG